MKDLMKRDTRIALALCLAVLGTAIEARADCHVGFIHQGGRLHAVAMALALHVAARQAVQLFIHDGGQPREGAPVSVVPGTGSMPRLSLAGSLGLPPPASLSNTAAPGLQNYSRLDDRFRARSAPISVEVNMKPILTTIGLWKKGRTTDIGNPAGEVENGPR